MLRAIEIFEEYGSIDYAHTIALDNVKKAKELLLILEDTPSRQALMMLADFVLERSN